MAAAQQPGCNSLQRPSMLIMGAPPVQLTSTVTLPPRRMKSHRPRQAQRCLPRSAMPPSTSAAPARRTARAAPSSVRCWQCRHPLFTPTVFSAVVPSADIFAARGPDRPSNRSRVAGEFVACSDTRILSRSCPSVLRMQQEHRSTQTLTRGPHGPTHFHTQGDGHRPGTPRRQGHQARSARCQGQRAGAELRIVVLPIAPTG